MQSYDHPRTKEVRATDTAVAKSNRKELLTTKEVATLTGFSTSYFEKARIYGYGPKFHRILANGKTGKILYHRSAIDSWLEAQECDPEAPSNG